MRQLKSGILRTIDANLNRSREGLRVCEDISRFILNSDSLTRELKALRHGIASALKEIPAGAAGLVGSRDAGADVGRSSKLATEMRRSSPLDVFMANIQRVKESLRVLEELSKLSDRKVAIRFQRLRFRTYDVEKKTVARLSALRTICSARDKFAATRRLNEALQR